MSPITRAVAVALMSGVLGGCIVHIKDDGSSRTYTTSTGWEAQQERNRNYINTLVLGTTLDEVRQRIGEPEFSEAFAATDGDYRILFYRTQHRRSDGKTTRDETTPVVFRNGAVIGFGDDFYRRTVGGEGSVNP